MKWYWNQSISQKKIQRAQHRSNRHSDDRTSPHHNIVTKNESIHTHTHTFSLNRHTLRSVALKSEFESHYLLSICWRLHKNYSSVWFTLCLLFSRSPLISFISNTIIPQFFCVDRHFQLAINNETVPCASDLINVQSKIWENMQKWFPYCNLIFYNRWPIEEKKWILIKVIVVVASSFI